jgi:hypothetical protein
LEIAVAQREVRHAFLRGGPGAVISGIVWLVAGIVATLHDVANGFVVLFFGGMLIFPAASFIVRRVFRRKSVSQENPNGLIVIETLFPMIGGFLAAWLFIPYRPDFVFPMSAIAVGAHYFGFRTAYGDWTNWILGGIMCAVGIASMFSGVPASGIVAYIISAIEIGFGLYLTWIGIAKESADALAGLDAKISG